MSAQPRIFITRQIAGDAIEKLRQHCDVDLWTDEMPPSRDMLLQRVADVQGLLCLLTERIDDELLDYASQLKVISNLAVGYDNIDVPSATNRSIPVGNTPDVLTETTADLAVALLMAAARRLPEAERYVHAGQWRTWSPTLLLGHEVSGATLGIIGFGRIGQAVARRANGFNMSILYNGGSDKAMARQLGAEEQSLDDLLAESDFVSIHTPLTDETYHLIGERELSKMKPTAILINTARGGIVDPAALYMALKDGTIAAAALDVTEPEPIAQDDPLLSLDNCLIVPHIGSGTVSTRRKMAMMAAENLLAGLRGERLPHCVNPQVYK